MRDLIGAVGLGVLARNANAHSSDMPLLQQRLEHGWLARRLLSSLFALVSMRRRKY